eukprot:g15455.t1
MTERVCEICKHALEKNHRGSVCKDCENEKRQLVRQEKTRLNKEILSKERAITLKHEQVLTTIENHSQQIANSKQCIKDLKKCMKTLTAKQKEVHNMLKLMQENVKSVERSVQKLKQLKRSVKKLEDADVKNSKSLHACQAKIAKLESENIDNETALKNLEDLRRDMSSNNTSDIKYGTFAVAFIKEFYIYGIYKLGSKPRGFGTLSERNGNFSRYPLELLALITSILGLNSISNTRQPVNLSRLDNVLSFYDKNLNFAMIDIVFNQRSLRKKDNRHLLHELYQSQQEASRNNLYTDLEVQDLVDMEENRFQRLFIFIFNHHLKNGLQQTWCPEMKTPKPRHWFSYENYKFYKMEDLYLSYTTEAFNRYLHLHTYAITREYYWDEPSLQKNAN